jgi:hypothetical protein
MDNQPLDSDEIRGLETRKALLEQRMIKGEELIRQEWESGNNKRAAELEKYWLKLLQEYEEICERLGPEAD